MVPDDDDAGVEPVARLALVEDVLQRADGEHQQSHAHPVGLHVLDRSFRQIADGHQQGKNAERHVDVEHHAPGIILGEVAAERGADHRRHHDAHAEDRQRLAVPTARKGIEQDRLAQRHQRRAEHALGQAEHHHALQAPRHAAQRRGHDEADNGGQQEPPSPKPFGEIAGQRHHHGGGDDVRRQHPGDLVRRGGKGAEHVRDRHVDDGHVEHFEHRGQHHGDHESDRRTHEGRFGRNRGGRRSGRLALAALAGAALGAAHCWPCAGSVVSMVTVALAPRRNGLSGLGALVIWTLTGKR